MYFNKTSYIIFIVFVMSAILAMIVWGIHYSFILLILVSLFLVILLHIGQKRQKYWKEAERQLRVTIDNLPFLAWLKDKDGRFIAVNQPFVRVSKKERASDIEGFTDLDVWPKDLAEKYRNDDAEVMRLGEQIIVTEMIHDNGVDRWFETYKSPVYNEAEDVIGTVGFAMDITKKQLYETQLQLTSVVFEKSFEGIVITDSDVKILRVNNAFTRITGYTEDEVYLKNPKMLASGRTSKSFYQQMWHDINETGQWSGEIWNKSKAGELYLEWLSITAIYDSNNTIMNFIGVFSDISVINESNNKLNFLAYHDRLTGLGNRVLLETHFKEYLEMAREQQQRLSLLFIDLDGFKAVNDMHSHDCGDKLLQAVAKRIQNMMRSDDLIIRLGGDEFVVVVFEDLKQSLHNVLAKKLIEKIAKPYEIGNKVITVGASIGIAVFPDHGDNLEALLKKADKSMYIAKEAGKQQYHI
jgi:diguanylate cyclase (GGDEF)-like protein/PAS domain S-box-containing protein